MSFIKFPKAVADIAIADSSVPVHYRVFLYLASRSDYRTGVLHSDLTADGVAEAVVCSRRSVYRSLKKLRQLGWLIGGSGLAGQLAGFKSRPYRSSASVRKSDIKAVMEEVAPHSPSSNGSRLKESAVPIREVRETQSFQEVLSRARRNIPEG